MKKAKFLVFGDFNGRTSSCNDFVLLDGYIDGAERSDWDRDKPLRYNQDQVIERNGRRLLELCQKSDLSIVNGRIHDDAGKGKFTFCSQQGMSTVDYVLTNHINFGMIKDFNILDFYEHSDPAPTLLTLHLMQVFK